ncbi:Striatin [Oopsacas minuta]|uniref:Striatin n=1 Tax=Oopsacas minuta TaxID=111878 RepID=A0AAV7KCT4_9METZ|nr:Striatin [Oopsacas minuta]
MDIPVGMAGVQVSLNGQAPPPPPGSESSYNIPGVLHFLKSEWVRFERERSSWELEKVELQSKIAFLNGQRKGHENLKRDLIRRIKMLEFALKQERSKNHKLVHGTDLILPDNKIEFESEPDIISSSTNLTEGRNVLRQYLRELGYTEGVLEARAKVKNVRSYPEPLSETEVVFLQENQSNEHDAFKESEVILSEVPLGDPVTTFDDSSDIPPRPSRPGLDGDDDDSNEFIYMTHFLQVNKLRHLNAFIRAYKSSDVITEYSPSSINRPLEHMVFSVKDNFAVKNQPMTCASAFLSDFKPIYTSTVVARILAAGGNLIGHCNMDEFAMGVANIHSHFGPCYNPWGEVKGETDVPLRYPRVPGGSSGGSAVAVLTGQSDSALGSDTSGSVRLPAAYCGIVGFKPSYGALSRYGIVPLVCSMDCPGILARNIQDITKVFRIVKGIDPLDPTSINIPESNHSNTPLSVGIYLPSNDDTIEECMKLRFMEAVEDLVSNYDVIHHNIQIPHIEYSIATYNTLCAVEVASNMARYNGLVYGTKSVNSSSYNLADEFISDTRSYSLGAIVKHRIILGTHLSTSKGKHIFEQATRMRGLLSRQISSLFRTETNPKGCDVIITPTASGEAPTRDHINKMGPVTASQLDQFLVVPSLAGLPAVSIPIGLSARAMPLGLQIVGGMGRDYEVLKVAEMVENCSRHTTTMNNCIQSICIHTEDTLGKEAPPHAGDQDVAKAFEEFSFLTTQESANSDDDGSSADDEDEASFERAKQTKKLKSFLNTYGPDTQPQQTELSTTKDKSAEENRWSEGLLPGEIETMKDQLRKNTEARKQKKNRPSREEMNNMKTVLQDDEAVFDTDTLTQQSVISSGITEGEKGSSNERDSQEAFQPFQGLGDAAKDKDLYGPLAMISVKADLDMEAGFEDVTRKMWEQRYSLQSHYDSVTTLEFHPSESFLLTASEDTTVKLWNFDTKTGLNVSKKPGVLDLEPVHTFRAHECPIVSLAISKLTPKFYTGDVNGNICTWNLNTSLAPFDEYDPQLLEEITVGHQNAIWDLVVHPTQDLLISAGADGVVKLWKPFNVAEFVLAENGENFQPTSICVISTDTNLLAVSYANARTAVFDINTEKLVTDVKSYESYDGTQGTQINRVVSHPTSPVIITAHEDKQINFFDYKTGEVIHSMIAHQDAVTGLDIDPQGLFVLTSGHDRSLRLWDYHSKSCIQEISTHWNKFDQGIFDAKFHPTLSYFASAGADALCKIFMKRND